MTGAARERSRQSVAKQAAQSATKPKRPAKRRVVKPKPGEIVIKPETSPPETATLGRVSLRSVGLWLGIFAVGLIAGVWLSGGVPINVGPRVVDVLDQCHVADRASQVRILREYAGQTFANDSFAQKWLNEQRIAARPIDWTPYTDELGKRCAEGPEAVKAFADQLERKP